MTAPTTPAGPGPTWAGATGRLRAVLEKGQRESLVIAHAGGEQEAPHSTPYAFQRAIALGSDVLELDVRLSSDGQLMVFHDPTLDRTTNATGPFEARTAAELSKLDNAHWFAPGCWDCRKTATTFELRGVRLGTKPAPAGFTADDFRIMTFDDLVTKYPDTVLNIEIKPNGPDRGIKVAKALAARLNADPAPDRFIVVSFSDKALAQFRAAAPTVATTPGSCEFTRYLFFLGKLHPTPVFQVSPSRYTARLRKKARSQGIAIWVWPKGSATDTEATYRSLLLTHPNGIIAGRPSELIALPRVAPKP